MQDAGHVLAEAFGDALAPCRGSAPEYRNRGAGHPDASRPWPVLCDTTKP